MSNQNVFNKVEFARLLEKAKGSRTITKYAEESGVSASHISRLLRGLLDTAPSPETISKLATKAYNKVSYKDLLNAAGHIEVSTDPEINDSDIQEFSPYRRRELYLELENRFMQIILSHLNTQDYDWSIQKPRGTTYRPDMMVSINDGESRKWYLEFKVSLSNQRGPATYHTYGLATSIDLEPTDKFTIVVNSENYYKQFIGAPPKNLRANLYVMLIDLEEGRIIKEEKICEYY